MRVYLMRHGVAQDRHDPAVIDDESRPLTAEGIERTRLSAHGMVTLGMSIDAILSSPLVRAVQTADLLGQALGVPKLAIEVHPALLPEADPEALLPILRNLEVESALCIGHSPHLDLIVARLLGIPRAVTGVKKAGLVVVEAKLHSDTARLVAVYEPKTLRQLGRLK